MAKKPKVPDTMPLVLHEQEGRDLMNTIQGFCEQSTLTRAHVIGALEGVKHLLLRKWFTGEDEDEDDDEDRW